MTYQWFICHTADHAWTTHKSRTYWVCACLCVEQFTRTSVFRGKNYWRITHESRMKPRTYHLQLLTNHWNIAHVDALQIRCSITRTFDARPTHASLTERAQTRTLYERSTYKHFRPAMNVIRALFVRDMKVGR